MSHRASFTVTSPVWLRSQGACGLASLLADALHHVGAGGLSWKPTALVLLFLACLLVLFQIVTGWTAWWAERDSWTARIAEQHLAMWVLLALLLGVNLVLRIVVSPDAWAPVAMSMLFITLAPVATNLPLHRLQRLDAAPPAAVG